VPSRRFHLPIRVGIVTRARAAAGDAAGARALFDAALEAAATTGERWYEPELLRFKAEALLAAGSENQDAAERCLDAALSLAREQEARLGELRAAIVLARLRDGAGRRAEAQALLTPIHGWFTEGLDTPDLRAAGALLEELSR
jgi:predicted ATPase